MWNVYVVCSNLASSGEPLLHVTTLTTGWYYVNLFSCAEYFSVIALTYA